MKSKMKKQAPNPFVKKEGIPAKAAKEQANKPPKGAAAREKRLEGKRL